MTEVSTRPDFPREISVKHTYHPRSDHDLYVTEPPHESGQRYVRADLVEGVIDAAVGMADGRTEAAYIENRLRAALEAS